VIAEPLRTWRRPMSGRKKSSKALSGVTGVQAAAHGEGIGRVNWGPSAASELDSQPGGIMHKPEGGRQRRRCGHSKQRAGRTTRPAGEPRATGPVVQVRSLRCRMVERPITDLTSRTEIRTVTASKCILRKNKRRCYWTLVPLDATDANGQQRRGTSRIHDSQGPGAACFL
jgi:hypothetical protein